MILEVHINTISRNYVQLITTALKARFTLRDALMEVQHHSVEQKQLKIVRIAELVASV